MGDRAKEDDHEFEELLVIVSRVFPEQLILGEADSFFAPRLYAM